MAPASENGVPTDAELKNAVPLEKLGKLPSTSEQYRALKDEIERSRPGVESAKRKSDTLNAETAGLKHRLAATAAQVQTLETDKNRLDTRIEQLSDETRIASAKFVQDRATVSRLLAVLERLQQDMPPAMALKPDDALAASRGAMVLGAALPRVYVAATDLARRVRSLNSLRVQLGAERAQGARTETALAGARGQLDQLLAMKEQEADEASARYGDLAAQLEAVSGEAGTLETLLAKVASLKTVRPAQSVTVVAASNVSPGLHRGALLRPVAGTIERGDTAAPGGEHAPGLSFLAPAGARVVAPADSQVLFAGRYHKDGLVLILESAGGYDLVLAGLERVDVRTGDALLAGEPLGNMPSNGAGSRLYFELRQNGKGVSPAPWLETDLRKAKRS